MSIEPIMEKKKVKLIFSEDNRINSIFEKS